MPESYATQVIHNLCLQSLRGDQTLYEILVKSSPSIIKLRCLVFLDTPYFFKILKTESLREAVVHWIGLAPLTVN